MRIIGVVAMVVLLLSTAVAPSFIAIDPIEDKSIGLHLLRVEHYLYIEAEQDVSECVVSVVFPPIYNYQAPALLEIHNDTSDSLVSYEIVEDYYAPNLLVNFSFENLEARVLERIHFSCWVVVQEETFDDYPEVVWFKDVDELPEDVRVHLVESEVVQLENYFLNERADDLRLSVGNNIVAYGDAVAEFVHDHRYVLFVLEYMFDVFFPQDAVTTLFLSGENVGRSHLASALFRLNNVPSRTLLALPDQGFWTQMHYMNEFYVPEYGWVMLDGTACEAPYPTHHQVILRICHPDDENDTKRDYIFKLMTGEERWLWFSTDLVTPYYTDCKQGSSRSQMFSECVVEEDVWLVETARLLSADAMTYYVALDGLDLTPEDRSLFESATSFQEAAVRSLASSGNLNQFIVLMNYALDEYEQISVA